MAGSQHLLDLVEYHHSGLDDYRSTDCMYVHVANEHNDSSTHKDSIDFFPSPSNLKTLTCACPCIKKSWQR